MRILLIISIFSWVVQGQDDGNPHQWDRKRRCDLQGYEPPCGVCEGYGGIPWGDRNEDIALTTCEPVLTPDEIDQSTLIRPQWGAVFTVPMLYEVVIGKKQDPFCFTNFPGKDSIGELCYTRQTGSKLYDMKETGAFRQDLKVETILGTIPSLGIHQGTNFWVVNEYALFPFIKIHQCVCAQIVDPSSKSGLFPIQYNWVDKLQYVGREILGVEYIDITLELDHWALGPHHLWSRPDNGQVVRMYQPFNGLHVYPYGVVQETIDRSKFEDIPPELCKPGGASIRIGCDDDGYPIPKEKSKKKSIMEKDHLRAKNKVPGHSYKGMDFEDMSFVLNQWLNSSSIKVRACEQFDVEELQRLQAILYLMKEDHFDSIYQATGDNRRIRHDVLNGMENDWTSLNKLAKEHRNPMMKRMRRDGHCHEAVMWYVHHITEDLKEVLSGLNIEIPLLSHMRHECNSEDMSSAEGKLCKAYKDQVTCSMCHSNALP